MLEVQMCCVNGPQLLQHAGQISRILCFGKRTAKISYVYNDLIESW